MKRTRSKGRGADGRSSAAINHAEEFNRRIDTPGLHRVGRSIHANERKTVLPAELVRKYESDSFWLDPAGNPNKVRVV